jgi:hypothetical protein
MVACGCLSLRSFRFPPAVSNAAPETNVGFQERGHADRMTAIEARTGHSPEWIRTFLPQKAVAATILNFSHFLQE